MSLQAEARKAVDIADILTKIREAVPDERPEITKTVAELNTLSNVLDDIDDLLGVSDTKSITYIQEDLKLVHQSITFTLSDIWQILGHTGNGAPNPSASAYRVTWKEICLHCRTHNRYYLSARIRTYHRFLSELCTILRRRPPSFKAIGDMRSDIQTLLDTQHRRLLTAGDGDTSDAVETLVTIPKQKSYERERLPSSPAESRDSWPREFFPAAPDVPTSPTATFSSTSWASGSVVETSHWAKAVFRDSGTIPATPISSKHDADTSRCYGSNDRYAKDHVQLQYEELFKVTFPGGPTVRLYHRQKDHRARILCETPEKSGHSWSSCKPLNTLECWRRKTALCLYKTRADSEPEWAALSFTTIERLVLFFCTFLSLRSHDAGHPCTHFRDWELKGEAEYFGGKIHDDGYIHALRIYRDSYSRAVRLQASILIGDMKNTPVWTAFITHKIYSPTWLRRLNRETVCVQELRRHIFSPRYDPPVTNGGEHLLEFTSESDAIEFIAVIRDLAAQEREP